MKRYYLTLLVLLVLTSNMVGCAQDTTLTPTTPTSAERTTAMKNYFNKALPIVEDHTRTMSTVYEAVEAIKAIYSQPPKAVGFKTITVEDIAAALKAKGTLDGGINKMANASQKVSSEIVDFGVLTPPAEAMNYHRLVTDCFLKDKVALSDWFYYYTTLRDRNYRDSETLERADRHYKEARELQLQAEQEWKTLEQKMRW